MNFFHVFFFSGQVIDLFLGVADGVVAGLVGREGLIAIRLKNEFRFFLSTQHYTHTQQSRKEKKRK